MDTFQSLSGVRIIRVAYGARPWLGGEQTVRASRGFASFAVRIRAVPRTPRSQRCSPQTYSFGPGSHRSPWDDRAESPTVKYPGLLLLSWCWRRSNPGGPAPPVPLDHNPRTRSHLELLVPQRVLRFGQRRRGRRYRPVARFLSFIEATVSVWQP